MHAKPNENVTPGTVGAQGTISTGRLGDLFKPSQPATPKPLSAPAAATVPIEPARELPNADWLDALDEVDPQDIPACPVCGDLCDTELLSGDWRHSRCDPDSADRRTRTLRLLRHVERIKKTL
jgi:hypothetical protein